MRTKTKVADEQVDLDKIVNRLGWTRDDTRHFKGALGPYTANLSWAYPQPHATLTVYRYDVLVFAEQSERIDSVYKRVYTIILQREEEHKKEFTKAFHQFFGKDST